jgi:hypothetical protein
MGALSLAVVKKEVEARNDSFLRSLAIYSSGSQHDYSQSPFWSPPVDRYGYGTWNFDSVDVPAAFAMYEQLKERVLNTGYFGAKLFRPYDHTNVTDMGLDPSQPWIGFEFETGYASKDAMRKCLGYCWDSFDNVTFDGEGEGEYFSEVTFAPANLSSFVDQSAPAAQYMKFLSDNREMTYNSGESAIGAHVNISLPVMRGCTQQMAQTLYNITPALNRSLGTLSADDNLGFFGRERLYAGFFLNSDNHNNSWFEGKLFRTTYEYDVYQNYIRVSRGLVKAIEALVETNGTGYYISNLFDLLSNPDTVEPVIGLSSSYPSTYTMNADGYPVDDYYDYDDYDGSGCQCPDCVRERGDY